MTWLLPCMLLGALTFRVRGGATEGWRFQLPGQVARLTWALACALTAFLAGAEWWAALAVLPMAFVATTLPLFDTIDMGRNQGSFLRDFAVGTLHGLSMGACVAAVLWVGGSARWYLPLIGGAAWGACYALCWLRRDWSELRTLWLGRYGNPPEAAELLFGAQFAGSLFVGAGL